MALDHIAPVFQRRGIPLSRIGFLLLRRAPLSTHLLGALFILPAVLLRFLVAGHLPPETIIALVAGAEILGMALATLAGCALGAEMITTGALDIPVPKGWSRGIAVLTTVILLWSATFLGWWVLSIDRKSRILK